MIHTVNITDTAAVLCAIMGAASLAAAYITGYTMMKRKFVDSIIAAGKDVDDSLKTSKHWFGKYKEMQEKYGEVFGKYNALQQEIECHIHEIYEETERPHVESMGNENPMEKYLNTPGESIWTEDKNAHTHNGWQEYVNEPEETLIEKMKENL